MKLPCNCSHEYQDKKYGKGIRIHTACAVKNAGMRPYRCTICENVKVIGEKGAIVSSTKKKSEK